VIQNKGEIANNVWVLIAGSAEATGGTDDTEIIHDDDCVTILETEVCLQIPSSDKYRL
jgi:hypothetical protein